jgi:hypothetical protein
MLNVLRLSQPTQQPKIIWYVASVMGVLLSLGCTVWQSQWAERSMPRLLEEKQHWQAALQQAPSKPSEQAALQLSLTLTTQRVQALEKRQSMRLDLAEVQALLFANSAPQNRHSNRLQKLRWQGGQFEWEGSSSSPEALQALLLQTSRFDRWQRQPQLVQMQSAPVLDAATSKAASSDPKFFTQSVAFKLEGQIEADSSKLLLGSQQP